MPVTRKAIIILLSYITNQISYKMCPIHNFTNTASNQHVPEKTVIQLWLQILFSTCTCLNNLVINIFSNYQNSTSE